MLHHVATDRIGSKSHFRRTVRDARDFPWTLIGASPRPAQERQLPCNLLRGTDGTVARSVACGRDEV